MVDLLLLFSILCILFVVDICVIYFINHVFIVLLVVNTNIRYVDCLLIFPATFLTNTATKGIVPEWMICVLVIYYTLQSLYCGCFRY